MFCRSVIGADQYGFQQVNILYPYAHNFVPLFPIPLIPNLPKFQTFSNLESMMLKIVTFQFLHIEPKSEN